MGPGRVCSPRALQTLLVQAAHPSLHKMQALTALLRRGVGTEGAQNAVRAFGTAVVAAENPFLRFSTPYPKAIDHSPLLATLPETQVCSDEMVGRVLFCLSLIIVNDACR